MSDDAILAALTRLEAGLTRVEAGQGTLRADVMDRIDRLQNTVKAMREAVAHGSLIDLAEVGWARRSLLPPGS